MPQANIITNAELRAKLTAIGSDVSIPVLDYPDAESALTAVSQLLDALVQAQADQNAFANPGEDVLAVVTATGGATQYEYPPASGTFYTVKPKTYTFSLNVVESVSNSFPILG